MAELYYDDAADLGVIQSRQVAVLGELGLRHRTDVRRRRVERRLNSKRGILPPKWFAEETCRLAC